jgi:hypothetical protein
VAIKGDANACTNATIPIIIITINTTFSSSSDSFTLDVYRKNYYILEVLLPIQ